MRIMVNKIESLCQHQYKLDMPERHITCDGHEKGEVKEILEFLRKHNPGIEFTAEEGPCPIWDKEYGPLAKKKDEAHSDLKEFVAGYIEAIYFTDTGEPDQPGKDAELDQRSLDNIIADCATFIAQARPLLDQAVERAGYSLERAGHDFWFTRNGHGVGFWDRNELEEGGLGDKLSAVCKKFGEVYTMPDGHKMSYEPCREVFS